MNKSDIIQFLTDNNITNYTFNEDRSISVEGDVTISSLITKLPVQFKKINGNFTIRSPLKTLKGCPEIVSGFFDCKYCKLKNLQYCPQTVGGDFICSLCQLKSLQYCPQHIYGNFECDGNLLISLEHGPNIVDGIYRASFNKLKTLEFLPNQSKFFIISETYLKTPNELNKLLNFNTPEYLELKKTCDMFYLNLKLQNIPHSPLLNKEMKAKI